MQILCLEFLVEFSERLLDRHCDLVDLERHARMGLKPILGLDLAACQRARRNRKGTVLDLKALPAKRKGSAAQRDPVFHMILQGLGIIIEIPLGGEGIALEFQRAAARICSA